MKTLLVTGGMGFIGSNFIRLILTQNVDVNIINLDNLSHGSNIQNLKDLEHHRNYRFVKGDIRDRELTANLMKGVESVVNIAAESHVDRSISDPQRFFDSNTLGVLVLLEACRIADAGFLQVSTDEVYGSAEDGEVFREEDRLRPSSPYAASKAAAEMLVTAYHKTYGLRTYITRSTNNFGPYQLPEKLVPKMIIRASLGLKIPIYGSGRQIRDWLHVQDHSEALGLVLMKGKAGDTYNMGSGNRFENLQIAKMLLDLLKKPESMIEHVEDRPGHDFQYSIDSRRIREELAWKPKRPFSEALKDTVEWYVKNEWWWKPIISDSRILSASPWKEKW